MSDYEKTLEVIKANTEFPVALPWNGEFGIFTLRMLNSTQIKACGNFSTLNLLQDAEEGKEPSEDDIIELKNMQERIMKFALVKPTFKEITEILEASDLIQQIKQEIIDLREKLESEKDSKAKLEVSKEIDAIELYLGFLVPDDFAAMLTSVIIQRDNTDIRRITKDILLESAILAERGHDNPSDHIDGIFTEFQKEDINKYAWLELNEFRERETMVKDTGKRWIRGSKKR